MYVCLFEDNMQVRRCPKGNSFYQDRLQFTYNVTWRSVRATIVAAEKK